MLDKTYRAVTLVSPDRHTHMALALTFNDWIERERPAQILHVHYYHDPRSHVFGLLIIYLETVGVPVLPRAQDPPVAEPALL
jgi:hypothetical protein